MDSLQLLSVAGFAAIAVLCSLSLSWDMQLPGQTVVRLDTAVMNTLFPPEAAFEVIGARVQWAEGPTPFVTGDGVEIMLFSDVNANMIYAWDEKNGFRPWRSPSGKQAGWGEGNPFKEPGSNGLLFDHATGSLIMCLQGPRHVAVLNPAGTTAAAFGGNHANVSVLASSFNGKLLNSPNDLAFGPDGYIYFTDPSYGRARRYEDGVLPEDASDRQQQQNRVYRVRFSMSPSEPATVELVSSALHRPNGIGFSPDFSRLYLAASDRQRPEWRVFDFDAAEGQIKNADGEVFADVHQWRLKLSTRGVSSKVDLSIGSQDGLDVDADGNVFATGPGGIWVFTPSGDLAGILATQGRTANCLLHDGFLWVTQHSRVLRIATSATPRRQVSQ